jgi:hypothetical protein
LCAGLFIYAQTGTVSGNINDNSKIALPGAKITLSPGYIPFQMNTEILFS